MLTRKISPKTRNENIESLIYLQFEIKFMKIILSNFSDDVLSLIISYIHDYKFKDNEHIMYRLVCKKWNDIINLLKCRMCLKGLYLLNGKFKNDSCYICGHILESNDNKVKRKEYYYGHYCCKSKLISKIPG